jgi:hypothetical protein
MTADQFIQGLADLFRGYQGLSVLVLILGNLAVGVAVALQDGEFTLAELGGILSKVAPYFGGFALLGAAGVARADVFGQVLQGIATALAGAKFGADTLGGASVLFKFTLPAWLSRIVPPAPTVLTQGGGATPPQT